MRTIDGEASMGVFFSTRRMRFTSDQRRLMEIERDCFNEPWDAEWFHKCLQESDIKAMVAERRGRVAGYLVAKLRPASIRVLSLAVDPEYRRLGCGTALLERAKCYVTAIRPRLVLDVAEELLEAQLFFRACGLLAVPVTRVLRAQAMYRMELVSAVLA